MKGHPGTQAHRARRGLRHGRLLVAFGLGFAGALPGASSGADAAGAAQVKLSDLVGSNVAGYAGLPDARITDALLDLAGKRIRYLVVTGGGRFLTCPYPDSPTLDGKVLSIAPTSSRDCLKQRPEDASLRNEGEAREAALRDREGEAIGQVKDYFVDPRTGALTHAIAAFDPQWYTGGGWVALPIASLAGEEGAFVARFAKSDIRPVTPVSAKPVAPPPPAPPPPPEPGDQRASAWVGAIVRDDAGSEAARVVDLLLDSRRREGALAVVARANDAAPMRCALGAQGVRVEGDHFRAPSAWSACTSAGDGGEASGRLSAKELLRAHVREPGGDDVGVLREVVVSAVDGRLHYLVADFDSRWVEDGKLTVLPARALRHHKGEPYVQAELNEIERYPMIDEKRLADVAAPSFARGVDTYLARADTQR